MPLKIIIIMEATITLNLKENLEKYINCYFKEKQFPYNFSLDVWKHLYELMDLKTGETLILSYTDQNKKEYSFISTMVILKEPSKDGMDYKILFNSNIEGGGNQIVYGNRNKISLYVKEYLLPKNLIIQSEQDIKRINVIPDRECLYLKLI
jgi:hypothetical protein